MAVDHAGAADAGAETVEQQRRVEAPPPPPDRPGAEGTPSRAESRAAAAADSSPQQGEQADRKPDAPSQAEESDEGQDTVAENRPDSSSSSTEKTDFSGLEVNASETSNDAGNERAETSPSVVLDRRGGHSEESSAESPRIDHPSAADGFPSDQDGASEGSETSAPDQRQRPEERLPEDGGRPGEAPGDPIEERRNPEGQPSVDQSGTEEVPPTGKPASDTIADQATAVAEADRTDQPAIEIPDAGRMAEQPDGPHNVGADTRSVDATDPRNAVEETGAADTTSADPAAESSEVSERPPEAEAISGEADAMVTESSETPVPAPESSSDGASPERGVNTGEGAGEGDRTDVQLMVDGRPLREYLDPVGAGGGSDEVGDQLVDPGDRAGEQMANAEDEEQSRVDKTRRKFYEVVEGAHEVTGKAASRGQELSKPPPTGHTETSKAPEAVSAQRDGISAADTATSLMVTGIVLVEISRWVGGKLKRTRGRDDGGNR